MLVCVSPGSNSLEESINALTYAWQARQIESVVRVNEFHAGSASAIAENFAVIEAQRLEIVALKEELLKLRSVCDPGFQDLDRSAPVVRNSTNVIITSPPHVASTLTSPTRVADASTECEGGALSSSKSAADRQLLDSLQSRLAALRDQKETLQEAMKQVDEGKDIELDSLIRSEKLKVAHHYATMKRNGTDPSAPPPIGVAGAQQAIYAMQKRLKENVSRRNDLSDAIDTSDRDLNQLTTRSRPPARMLGRPSSCSAKCCRLG